jgi:hypothetical protein
VDGLGEQTLSEERRDLGVELEQLCAIEARRVAGATTANAIAVAMSTLTSRAPRSA